MVQGSVRRCGSRSDAAALDTRRPAGLVRAGKMARSLRRPFVSHAPFSHSCTWPNKKRKFAAVLVRDPSVGLEGPVTGGS